MLGILVRAAGITCILLAIGSASFAMIARAHLIDSPLANRVLDRTARIGMYATLLLVPVAGARLYLQLDGMRFPGEPLTTSLTPLLTTSTWGNAWSAQILFAFVSAAAFGASIRARGALMVTSLSLTILALTFALSGHAAGAADFRMALVSADALHVLTAGTWIGTLAMLVVNWKAVRDLNATASVINAFSPLALASAGILTVSGTIAALSHISPIGAIFTSPYGRVLLVKLVLVALVITAGWFNWKQHSVRISTDEGAALLRGARQELGAAIGVIVATALLTGMSPP